MIEWHSLARENREHIYTAEIEQRAVKRKEQIDTTDEKTTGKDKGEIDTVKGEDIDITYRIG